MLNETPKEVVVEVVQYIKWKDELTMLFRGGNNEIMRYDQSILYLCVCIHMFMFVYVCYLMIGCYS